MNLETVAPRVGHKTLLYSELVTNLAGIQADLAVIGMPFGAAYTPRAYSNDQSNAPQALRELSDRMVRAPEHYDFDIDGPLLQGRKDIRFVDCGDILPSLTEPREHYHKLEAAIKELRKGGALPIILGGDHGITTPALRGYADEGPITVCILMPTSTGAMKSMAYQTVYPAPSAALQKWRTSIKSCKLVCACKAAPDQPTTRQRVIMVPT